MLIAIYENCVIKISLFDKNLVGSISDFNGLPNLQFLKLFYNTELTGPIPNFSNLPNLRELYLYNSKFKWS